MPVREDMLCECGSVLSAVTFDCVRGQGCPVPNYIVEVNRRGRIRKLEFKTLARAQKFCDEVFQATGDILAITQRKR